LEGLIFVPRQASGKPKRVNLTEISTELSSEALNPASQCAHQMKLCNYFLQQIQAIQCRRLALPADSDAFEFKLTVENGCYWGILKKAKQKIVETAALLFLGFSIVLS
jgi:hypothetical protein